MKHLTYGFLLVILAMLLNSCLLTFYPIYTPKDVVYETSILGSYRTEDVKDGQPDEMDILPLGSSGIRLPEGIAAIKNKGYLVKFKESDGRVRSQYIAFVVVLNSNKYIDFYPYTPEIDKFGAYGQHKVPMHAIYQISLQGNRKLILKRFDQDFLNEMIEKRQLRIRHEKLDDKYVITASTSELQQYISKYGNNADAYEKDFEHYIKK